MNRRRLLGTALLGTAGWTLARAGFSAASASAPSFAPNRAVKLIIPQSPGGAADRLARVLGKKLEARWKQPVVVENRPGGGVVVGTLATARSAPDGYTLGLLGSSLTINAVQRKDLPYDLFKDLLPLVRVGYYTVALVAVPSFPANDVKGLIALAKSQPGKLFYGSNGIGTSAHLAGEMLNHMAGVELQHVPYNGAAKMYTDMLSGEIPLGISIATSAESFVKEGRLKVLGVTSMQRSALYPAWPAIAETLPGFESINWAGFVAPAGLADEVARGISDDILFVLRTPEMATTIAGMGIDLSPLAPAEFEAFLRSEMTRFAALTKPLGTRMQ